MLNGKEMLIKQLIALFGLDKTIADQILWMVERVAALDARLANLDARLASIEEILRERGETKKSIFDEKPGTIHAALRPKPVSTQ